MEFGDFLNYVLGCIERFYPTLRTNWIETYASRISENNWIMFTERSALVSWNPIIGSVAHSLYRRGMVMNITPACSKINLSKARAAHKPNYFICVNEQQGETEHYSSFCHVIHTVIWFMAIIKTIRYDFSLSRLPPRLIQLLVFVYEPLNPLFRLWVLPAIWLHVAGSVSRRLALSDCSQRTFSIFIHFSVWRWMYSRPQEYIMFCSG